MVGFWDRIHCRDRGLDNPGPGQPFPDSSRTSWTWPHEMSVSNLDSNATPGTAATSVGVSAIPTLISPVWEPVASTSTSTFAPKPNYNQCFQGF
jgi:hypothetical protein